MDYLLLMFVFCFVFKFICKHMSIMNWIIWVQDSMYVGVLIIITEKKNDGTLIFDCEKF